MEEFKTCRKGLHQYPKELKRCPECLKTLQQSPSNKISQKRYHMTEKGQAIAKSPAQKKSSAKYMKTEKGRYANAKRIAKKKGQPFTLTREEYLAEIIKPCFYCQDQLCKRVVLGMGLDRCNNNFGYVQGNVVSCGQLCNGIKGATLTQEETFAAVQAILTIRGKKKIE